MGVGKRPERVKLTRHTPSHNTATTHASHAMCVISHCSATKHHTPHTLPAPRPWEPLCTPANTDADDDDDDDYHHHSLETGAQSTSAGRMTAP